VSDPARATIAFFPEPGAWGPANNCVAIAEVLADRGHRIVFVIDESFEGVLEKRGFEERLMRMAPPEEADAGADPWAEFIRVTAPEFRKPTIEQIATVTKPIWEALVAGERYSHGRLLEIWADVRPDVVVTDNVTGYAAVELAGAPWIRFVSANPLEMRDPALPPPLSGLPVDDPSEWAAFRDEYHRQHADLLAEHNDFRASVGVGPCPPDEFNTESPYLNLYLYPEVADYARSRPLAPTWRRLDSCVREASEPWEPPPGDGKLVYLSLGSLGSGDVELMRRLIGFLAETDHRVVVSMGPQHEELELAPNMVGAEFLPQPAVLPHVDLVVTHGGNNTVTESLHFGKPMVVLPLFWDQYDNAQRMDELGLGIRLAPYEVEGDELRGAIDRLLGDEALARRLGAISTELQARPGTVVAADAIESLVA
jgi:MGT family glycosyltransferase